MRAELRRSIFLGCVGLLAGFALVVTLYGAGTLFKRGLGSPTALETPADADASGGQGARRADGPVPPAGNGQAPVGDGKAPAGDGQAPAGERKSAADQGARPGEGASQAAGKPLAALQPPNSGPPQAAEAPSFDIIRIEPDGEAVIAGRAPPNTTVELLRDGKPIARALVDPSGQFALVPPALPSGASEITLRGTGADGQVRTSRDSVAVVVAANRATKPLIALTSPDKPTIVLSQPDSVTAAATPAGTDPNARKRDGNKLATTMPGDGAKAGPATNSAPPRRQQTAEIPKAGSSGTGSSGTGSSGTGTSGTGISKPESRTAQPEAAGAEKPAPVKIVSVEAEEGGRLYVTSQAQAGATVRLYLNDTLVAPGSAGPDGRVAFTIGRGVRPGDYRIRVDQVDPVSGAVKTRSEVAFTVPAAVLKPAVRAPDVASATGPTTTPGPASGSQARLGTPENPATLPPAALPKESPATAALPAAGHPGAGLAPSRLAASGLAASGLAASGLAASGLAEPNPTKPGEAKPVPVTPGIAGAAPIREAAQASKATPTEGTRTVFVPEVGTATITRGDSLWQISRRIYGKGTRYTVIFDANQPQIRNPNLIYPGQIFVVPSDGTATGPEAVPAAGTRG